MAFLRKILGSKNKNDDFTHLLTISFDPSQDVGICSETQKIAFFNAVCKAVGKIGVELEKFNDYERKNQDEWDKQIDEEGAFCKAEWLIKPRFQAEDTERVSNLINGEIIRLMNAELKASVFNKDNITLRIGLRELNKNKKSDLPERP